METKKKKYIYDYPEQRELSSKLIFGERGYIARITEYSSTMLTLMCNGSRKMTDEVKELMEAIISGREETVNRYTQKQS